MRLLLVPLLVFASASGTQPRAAEVYIGVEGSAKTELVLGLAPFFPADAKSREETELGAKLRDVVRTDLLSSRAIALIEQGPPADVTDPDAAAKVWRERGAAFLLEASAAKKETQAALTVKLTDLGSGQALLSRHYRLSYDFWRSLAHQAADDIVRQLTGRRGLGQTRIAFANDQTGAKELYVIDADGARPTRLTNNRSINLFPRWRPDGKAIAFTSYKDGNPDIHILDLERGRSQVLSDRQGLNLAGGFSPDGSQIAATLSRGKDPNVFIIDLKSGNSKRATNEWGVESSPTFSPDGLNIAYVSDRSGNPAVYALELATGRTRRLTGRLGWCDSPSWSPTGEWIAFAGRANPKDRFDIFLVDVTGTRTIQLTHGEGSNEEPSWSPDGRFLVFASTRDKRRRLYVMDADGSAPHALADIPGNSFTPNWGP
ncbi:MAG: hypothetical protein WC728_18775 [Elusimicrobiota bacterium]